MSIATEVKGSLTVVGTGLCARTHATLGAVEVISRAQRVLFAIADDDTASWLRSLNDKVEPLAYDVSQTRRRVVYEAMVESMLAPVRRGLQVCAVFYGHPGVFVWSSHEAIRRARREGFVATMLPGVSAEDCLIADVGLDPAALGCQSFEATDFLIRPRRFDTSTTLILWQVGNLGNLGFGANTSAAGRTLLAEVLIQHYGPSHRAYVYEASTKPGVAARIEPIRVDELAHAAFTLSSTLLVPAKHAAALEDGVMQRLGMSFPDRGAT